MKLMTFAPTITPADPSGNILCHLFGEKGLKKINNIDLMHGTQKSRHTTIFLLCLMIGLNCNKWHDGRINFF